MQSTGMVVSVGVDDRPPLSCVGSLLKRKRPGPVEMALSPSLPVENTTNCRESYSCRGKDMQRNSYLSSVGDLTGKGSVSDGEKKRKKKKKKKSAGTMRSDRICMIPESKNRRKYLPRLIQPTIDGRGIIKEATGIACHACGAHATMETDIHTHGKSDKKGTRAREKQQQLYISPCPRYDAFVKVMQTSAFISPFPICLYMNLRYWHHCTISMTFTLMFYHLPRFLRNGFFLSHSCATPVTVSPPPYPLQKCRHCEKLACNSCLR